VNRAPGMLDMTPASAERKEKNLETSRKHMSGDVLCTFSTTHFKRERLPGKYNLHSRFPGNDKMAFPWKHYWESHFVKKNPEMC
jgi:hypothetical protein